MKKRILILMSIALFCVLSACSEKDNEKEDERIEDVSNNTFAFEYTIWNNENQKNIFSTMDDIIQKDLITAGVAKNKWEISEKDLLKIKELIEKNDITAIEKKLVENNFSTNDTVVYSTATKKFCFKFIIDSKEYVIEGDETIYNVSEENVECKKICNFFDELKDILYSQKEYIDMPEAKGEYQ